MSSEYDVMQASMAEARLKRKQREAAALVAWTKADGNEAKAIAWRNYLNEVRSATEEMAASMDNAHGNWLLNREQNEDKKAQEREQKKAEREAAKAEKDAKKAAEKNEKTKAEKVSKGDKPEKAPKQPKPLQQ